MGKELELNDEYRKPTNIPQTNSTQWLQFTIYLTSYQNRGKEQRVWVTPAALTSPSGVLDNTERWRRGKGDNWELTIQMDPPKARCGLEEF